MTTISTNPTSLVTGDGLGGKVLKLWPTTHAAHASDDRAITEPSACSRLAYWKLLPVRNESPLAEMSERQKQGAFLKALIQSEDPEQGHPLLEQLKKAERDERCVRRAFGLVSLVGFSSLCGMGYSTVFVADLFRISSHLVFKSFCALGLASAICMVVFLGCWMWHRHLVYRVHDQLRRRVMAKLESRCNNSIVPLPAGAVPKVSEPVDETPTPAGEIETAIVRLRQAQ
jgi:hypothetical protein